MSNQPAKKSTSRARTSRNWKMTRSPWRPASLTNRNRTTKRTANPTNASRNRTLRLRRILPHAITQRRTIRARAVIADVRILGAATIADKTPGIAAAMADVADAGAGAAAGAVPEVAHRPVVEVAADRKDQAMPVPGATCHHRNMLLRRANRADRSPEILIRAAATIAAPVKTAVIAVIAATAGSPVADHLAASSPGVAKVRATVRHPRRTTRLTNPSFYPASLSPSIVPSLWPLRRLRPLNTNRKKSSRNATTFCPIARSTALRRECLAAALLRALCRGVSPAVCQGGCSPMRALNPRALRKPPKKVSPTAYKPLRRQRRGLRHRSRRSARIAGCFSGG